MWLINLLGSRGGTSDAMERIWSQTCPGVFITGDRKLDIIACGSLDLVRTLDYCCRNT